MDTKTLIVGGNVAPETVDGSVEFQNISFAYPDREQILNEFSLSIPKGKTTAIVGPTGSGKSTIVRLLLRFYDPQAGVIQLDNHALQDWDLERLRQSIGFVSQSVYLLDGTVWENILYGRPNATEDEVIAAAKSAEVHDFIESLPEGYHTSIGERGLKEWGQSQRNFDCTSHS